MIQQVCGSEGDVSDADAVSGSLPAWPSGTLKNVIQGP